jgi:DNA-directed RNA polymerase specialized sigma24 family protein
VQKGVSQLPEQHRKALAWSYVFRGSPKRVARDLAVSMDGLMVLVTDGRTMLVNRRV